MHSAQDEHPAAVPFDLGLNELPQVDDPPGFNMETSVLEGLPFRAFKKRLFPLDPTTGFTVGSRFQIRKLGPRAGLEPATNGLGIRCRQSGVIH